VRASSSSSSRSRSSSNSNTRACSHNPPARRTGLVCRAAKELHFNRNMEALKRMQAGVDKLSTVVGVTIGPKVWLGSGGQQQQQQQQQAAPPGSARPARPQPDASAPTRRIGSSCGPLGGMEAAGSMALAAAALLRLHGLHAPMQAAGLMSRHARRRRQQQRLAHAHMHDMLHAQQPTTPALPHTHPRHAPRTQGRNVVLESKYGSPKIVNDGVTIAREVELEDPVENIGCKLVRQVRASLRAVRGPPHTACPPAAWQAT